MLISRKSLQHGSEGVFAHQLTHDISAFLWQFSLYLFYVYALNLVLCDVIRSFLSSVGVLWSGIKIEENHAVAFTLTGMNLWESVEYAQFDRSLGNLPDSYNNEGSYWWACQKMPPGTCMLRGSAYSLASTTNTCAYQRCNLYSASSVPHTTEGYSWALDRSDGWS